MGKFYGSIGFAEYQETSPGVWTEVVVERSYRGDIISNNRRWQPSENLNDNLAISNTISILADIVAMRGFHNIRYIVWMGQKWKVSSIDVQKPRLVLSIGGVYNESKS